jgi:hypothetical protein
LAGTKLFGAQCIKIIYRTAFIMESEKEKSFTKKIATRAYWNEKRRLDWAGNSSPPKAG